MYILAFSYFLIGIYYIVYELLFITKAKGLYMISFFRVMYAFVYGFLPGIFLFRIANGSTTLDLIFSESKYVQNGIIAFIASIIEYFIINFVYNNTKRAKAYNRTFSEYPACTIKIALVITLIYGIISLFLWTRAYGSVWNFIKEADSIRASYSTIYNPFAFMEHFTKVFPICTFISFSLLIKEKENGKPIIFVFLLFIISLIFSLVVTLCTDSRGSIAVLIVVLGLYYFSEKIIIKGYSIKKAILIMVCLCVLAFCIIIISETVMGNIRHNTSEVVEAIDIFASLEDEFGYTLQSQIAVIEELSNNPFQFKFYNDFTCGIFSWVPSRFIPFNLPTDLWDYNTDILLQYLNFSGQAPTDFVTASLYMFGPLGVVLLPLLFGWTLKKIDTLFRRKKYSPYLMVFYCRFMYYCFWWVSHFSISYTVLSLFGMFLVHIVIYLTNRVICYIKKRY